jgi:hypothetical protein
MAYQSGRFGGVGYTMHGGGLIGIDLDTCVAKDGTIATWALEIVHQFEGAYWERSISGTGLRGFCRGTLPDGVGGRRGKIEGCSVEVYADARFLVITGRTLECVDALPELQAAVDDLVGRLDTRGRRARGTAVATGLTGPNVSPSPEVMAILGDVMGGRHHAHMSSIWGRLDPDATECSERDWALESEVAYHAIRSGYTGDDLARIVEETMRAGPYRSKWDSPRGASTWLARDIANAIATVQERLTHDAQHGGGDQGTDAVSAESLQEKVIRLERELAHERAISAVQMTTIRTIRAERDECRARALEMARVLRNPALKPPEKLIGIALAWRVESAASRGQEEVRAHYPEIAEAVGMSEDSVGRYVGSLSDREDAPLIKRTVTEWRELPDPETGQMINKPTSATYVRPRAVGSILSAIATYRPGDRPKHGGKRLPRCPEHPTADVVIRSTTHCADCDRRLGPPRESLRPQLAAIGDSPPTSVDGVTNEPQVAVVGVEPADDERAAKMVATNVGATVLRRQDAAEGAPGLGAYEDGAPPAWLVEWPDDLPPMPPSGAICTRCPEPLAPGDRIYCAPHRAEADLRIMPWERVPAVAGASE